MAYLLFAVVLFTVIAGSLLYWTRQRWTAVISGGFQTLVRDRLPSPSSFLRSPFSYTRLPSTFAGDAEAGLSSSTFDLSGNLESGDSRAGLDDQSKAAILAIMKKRRLPFDEARRVFLEQRFSANGIGPDGRPRDPKFVSFS